MARRHQVTTILAIAAHPDDEALGCGGTLAKHAQDGDSVFVLILGTGATAREYPFFEDHGRILSCVDMLKRASEDAGRVLGAQEVRVMDLPDNRMDSLDLLDIIKTVEPAIRHLKPEVIYTHAAGDRNVDHRRVHDAVLTACRPVPGCSVKRILSFEVQSSTEWGSGFKPNVFVDISGKPLESKMAALECYSSEMRDFPHARSTEAVLALSTLRGATVGIHDAEAFELVRSIE